MLNKPSRSTSGFFSDPYPSVYRDLHTGQHLAPCSGAVPGAREGMDGICRVTKIPPPSPLPHTAFFLVPVILVTDQGLHILCPGRPRIAQQSPRACAVWPPALPCSSPGNLFLGPLASASPLSSQPPTTPYSGI